MRAARQTIRRNTEPPSDERAAPVDKEFMATLAKGLAVLGAFGELFEEILDLFPAIKVDAENFHFAIEPVPVRIW